MGRKYSFKSNPDNCTLVIIKQYTVGCYNYLCLKSFIALNVKQDFAQPTEKGLLVISVND